MRLLLGRLRPTVENEECWHSLAGDQESALQRGCNSHCASAAPLCSVVPECRCPALAAESCLASQTVGSTRHGSSPDVDRVLGVLAAELGTLVEGSLRAAQRCAVIEALLYLQARGEV